MTKLSFEDWKNSDEVSYDIPDELIADKRWAKKNPGGREAAAARGTRVHSLMEEYLLGVEKNPVIDDPEIEAFWKPSSLNLF